MKYQGLPDFLRPYGNDWLTAGAIAKILVLKNIDEKVSSTPGTHSWVYKNKGRIKNHSLGPMANGKGEVRRYLVKSVWCVAMADGLKIEPTYSTSPMELKLKCLEERNAVLENAIHAPKLTVVHQAREFNPADVFLLKLLVLSSEPRPKPGVYFLVSGSNISYVGQSKNVLSRMAGHQLKDFDIVKMVEIADEKQRLEIEMRLIKLFNPRDNINGLLKAA